MDRIEELDSTQERKRIDNKFYLYSSEALKQKLETSLSNGERQALEVLYGILDGKKKNKTIAAKILGVSTGELVRLEKSAVKKCIERGTDYIFFNNLEDAIRLATATDEELEKIQGIEKELFYMRGDLQQHLEELEEIIRKIESKHIETSKKVAVQRALELQEKISLLKEKAQKEKFI